MKAASSQTIVRSQMMEVSSPIDQTFRTISLKAGKAKRNGKSRRRNKKRARRRRNRKEEEMTSNLMMKMTWI